MLEYNLDSQSLCLEFELVMKKLKNEKEMVKKAIAEGVKYGEKRGVVEFEPTDSSSDDTIDFGYKLGTGGGEGCTPGYWKQSHHFDSWPAPYTPTMLFSDVFADDPFPGKTLHDVLKQGGGHIKALGRHTVAALLNAGQGAVDYAFTTSEVIENA